MLEMIQTIDWKMFAGPVIGAVIGYCTNWLAVKMLFRPRYPKYIFKHKLPFTPGIIPKGKSRLANAIGNAVGNQLFTQDIMESVLLSDKIKDKIVGEIDKLTDKGAENEVSLKTSLTGIIDETSLNLTVDKVENYLSDRIEKNIRAMNVGDIIAARVADAVKSKVHGSMLALMISDNLIDSLSGQVALGIDDYVDENIGEIVSSIVKNELSQLLDKPVGEIVASAADSQIDLSHVVLSIYEKLVKDRLPDILSVLDFGGVARDRIESMKVEDVEELVLSVMKKELGAVINLGALIGFILGLFNMLFYN